MIAIPRFLIFEKKAKEKQGRGKKTKQ